MTFVINDLYHKELLNLLFIQIYFNVLTMDFYYDIFIYHTGLDDILTPLLSFLCFPIGLFVYACLFTYLFIGLFMSVSLCVCVCIINVCIKLGIILQLMPATRGANTRALN